MLHKRSTRGDETPCVTSVFGTHPRDAAIQRFGFARCESQGRLRDVGGLYRDPPKRKILIPPAQNSTTSSSRVRNTGSSEFVTALARAYTLSEIFPLHHPTVQDAVRDVAEWLGQFEFSVVQVEPIGLIIDEEVVPDDHGHVREFARDLSLAGVTEIAFGPALDPDHVERLLTALRLVSEEPDVALDDFLRKDGACDIELAFHGGARSPLEPVKPDTAPQSENPPKLLATPVGAAEDGHGQEAELQEPQLGDPHGELSHAESEQNEAPQDEFGPVGERPFEAAAVASPQLSIVPSHFAVDGVVAESGPGLEELSAEEALEYEQRLAVTGPDREEALATASPELETAPVEPLEIEVDEPLREFTVEEEIDEELVIEPLGAFLVDSTAERDAETRPHLSLVNDDTEPKDNSGGGTEATESVVPATSDWRTEVRSRLMSASDVPVSASTAPSAPVEAEAVGPEATALDPAALETTAGDPSSTEDSPSEDSPFEHSTFEDSPSAAESTELPSTALAFPITASLATPAPVLHGIGGMAAQDHREHETDEAQPDVEDEQYDDVDLMLPGAVTEWDRESYAAEWGAELEGDLEEDDEYPSYSEWIAEEALEGEYVDAAESPSEASDSTHEDAQLLAEEFVPPGESSDEPVVAHQPVAPVLDELEQALFDTASELEDPAHTVADFAAEERALREAAPAADSDLAADVAPGAEASPLTAWPSEAYVSAFQAALSENGRSASEVGGKADAESTQTMLAAPEPVHDVKESMISAFWVEDTAAVAADVGESPFEENPEQLEEYQGEGPGFPGVDSFAPDGPTLVDTEESFGSLHDEAVDPEVERLENELAAEAAADSPTTLAPPLPGEISSPAHEGHESGAATAIVEAPPVAPLVAFAHQFIDAQEPAKGALGETIRIDAARQLEHDLVDDIATSIDVLVRESVPGDHAATDLARELATPRVVDELCTRLSDVRDADRRDELIYVFGQLSTIMAPALSDRLSEVPPRTARRNFMDALFSMKSEAIAVAVPMLEDSRWFIVRNGVDVLGEAGDESCVVKLAPSLAHPDQRVRRATVMALAKLGGERAGGELLPVLEDPNSEVREAAAMALGHLRIQKALRPMLALLDRDKSDEAQMVILRSLGQIGDPGAVPAIEKRAVGFFFIKPSKPVRIAAYRALAAIGTPHARQLVMDAVNDRDAEVAATAHTLAAQL